MAENHNKNGRDAVLKKHFRTTGETLSIAKNAITKAKAKRKVEKRIALLTQAGEALERAEAAACDLFKEGATWQRKFDGLEAACSINTALDLETVAWLYWSCKRFFEAGVPELIAVQKSMQQCEHCQQRANGVSFAILAPTLTRLRDVLQQADVSMPELCLTINGAPGSPLS